MVAPVGVTVNVQKASVGVRKMRTEVTSVPSGLVIIVPVMRDREKRMRIWRWISPKPTFLTTVTPPVMIMSLMVTTLRLISVILKIIL